MIKVGKVRMKKWLNKTERILLDNKFERTIESDKMLNYEWVYRSEKYGNFYLNVNNDPESQILYAHGRFTDVDKIKGIFTEANPYSGKMNKYFFINNIDIAISEFEKHIKYIVNF